MQLQIAPRPRCRSQPGLPTTRWSHSGPRVGCYPWHWVQSNLPDQLLRMRWGCPCRPRHSGKEQNLYHPRCHLCPWKSLPRWEREIRRELRERLREADCLCYQQSKRWPRCWSTVHYRRSLPPRPQCSRSKSPGWQNSLIRPGTRSQGPHWSWKTMINPSKDP